MNLKRDLVKYVRDKAKSQYKKSPNCYICNSTSDLDFHHFYGLTELLETWIKKKKLIINNEQEILEIREAFIDGHYKELYEDTVTLCHSHHMKLHSVYGKRPKLIHAEKQKRWVEKQRDKYGMVR
jgi:queuine/archaeosine tRNA-ribosyltransferase